MSAPPEPGHRPVLLDEIVEELAPRAGETVIDCTAGRGGHAAALAQRIGATGTLIVNDADPANAAFASARASEADAPPRVLTWRGNFVDAPRKMVEAGLRADVVLADLGFASNQMDDSERGLSFRFDGPLDMRFDPAGPVTAAQLVTTLPEVELAEILRDFGEERAARAIARKLVAERESAPIDTTARLASIVCSVLGPGGGGPRIHPATRTFQALRIAVNDELGCLRSLLESVTRGASLLGTGGREGGWLSPGARIGVIAFHSLEDRLVKQAWAELVRRGLAESATRRPIEPGEEERRSNPRSRSARLRVVRLASGR